MNTQKKQGFAAIALILILAISTFMIFAPSTNAILMPPINFDEVFAYISVVPNPIGVDQIVLVTYRLDQPALGALVRTNHFNGTSVTITKPDGTSEVRSDLAMDATSSGWFTYTPTSVGTYKFQMHFPKHEYWANITGIPAFGIPSTETYATYAADDSDILELVVQEEPVPGYERSPPLPTDPWRRPIYGENKGWWQVADNWLMRDYDREGRGFAGTPAFAPYTSGPDSPHILWTKPIVPGGIVGGSFGDRMYYSGISYEQFFDPIVLQGTVLFGEHGLTAGTVIGSRFFDLYSGQDYPLMYMNDTNIAFAQILEIDTPNEHGPIPYLVVARTVGFTVGSWEFYEMLPNMQQTPRLRFTLSGLSGLLGWNQFGPNGEILSFQISGNATHRWMSMFNSTRAALGLSFGTGIDVWSPSGTINASRRLNQNPGGIPTAQLAAAEAMSHSPYMGIEWNVTLPDIEGVTQIIGSGLTSTGLVNYAEGYVLGGAVDVTRFPYVYSDVAYDVGSIKQDANGAYPSSINHLFAKNFTMIHDIHDRYSNHIRDGMYIRFDEGEEVLYGIDIKTGDIKWQTDPWNNAWGLFTRIYELAYGLVVTSGMDGHVRAYNMTNGTLEWDFYKGNAPYDENAYGTYPEYAGLTIADNTVYTTADEHSSDAIIWRGSQLWALNAMTGELQWKINGMFRHPTVVDGVLMAFNTYDGQVYVFGKGPSKTTISAPQTQVTLGGKVMLTGTVTDQTPSSKDTPAVSDESMGLWMEYMYQQKSFPANVTGVEVTISVLDSNNNYYEIGKATSDASGTYHLWWEPEVPGEYTIVATFAGSNSYGSSYAQTAMGVVEAPAASPTPPPVSFPPTESYVVGTGIAIIAAVAIVGFLLLRRH